jgi:ribonuclease G
MSDELLINSGTGETRVALVENGLLQEAHIERANSSSVVGNIYRGKVIRVLPGMQAVFVDLGLSRSGFLHVSDCTDEREAPEVVSLFHDGQKVLVQVVKAPLGTKGARLTTQLSLSSRYLVFNPLSSNIGISQRIEDEQERDRLRTIIDTLISETDVSGGFILRTAAENIVEEELGKDMVFLLKRWMTLQDSLIDAPVPSLVYSDLPLELRVLRDLAGPQIERIRFDFRESFERAQRFVDSYAPELKPRMKLYSGSRPLFDLYSVEDEIAKALRSSVPLKSGGSLVIEQTEAMTTVDVNTGTFVGSRNLEETILKTNLEAATALARQLRIRNLGGIIIIDFIDMESGDHKRQVIRALEKALERDRAKTMIAEVSAFGVVEMTRKRTSESLEHQLCEACQSCGGSGRVKTVETLCFEVFREIIRASSQFESNQVLVLGSEAVIGRIQDDSEYLGKLLEIVGRPIEFKVEPLYLQEQYDIIPI